MWTITDTNCGTTYSNKIHWISMLSMILQTPPVGATRPWFPHHQSGCQRGKVLWWFCWRAEHRPRPGRDGEQSVKWMTHGWLVAEQQIPNLKQLLMLGYLTGNLCQQTACTLILKETPHVSCIRSPPGLEVIITNVTQTQLCGCLVHAKGISQDLRKNWSVNRLPDPFSWTQRRVWGNPVFAYN